MFATGHTALRVLIVGIFFLSTLPGVARSQEEYATSSEQLEGATTATIAEYVYQYKLESLQGDKVFNDFVLGPGKIEVEIKPGETRVVNLNVSNRYDEPKNFKIQVEDMEGTDSPTQPIVLLGDDTGPYTLKDYVSVPQEKFTLAENKRAIIPVTISIPPDAEPGGRYGSVLVNTVAVEAQKNNTGTAGAGSAIVSRIGTLFFVTVPGDADTSGELKDFSIKNSKFYFEKGPIDFQILYENTGSVHLNPYGELRITNMLGEEVGYKELDPWFTMPGSIRLREISWNREMLYGRYVATLELNRGYDNIIDQTSVTFWVIPWKIVVGVFVVMYCVFFLIRGFFRRFEFKRKD